MWSEQDGPRIIGAYEERGEQSRRDCGTSMLVVLSCGRQVMAFAPPLLLSDKEKDVGDLAISGRTLADGTSSLGDLFCR